MMPRRPPNDPRARRPQDRQRQRSAAAKGARPLLDRLLRGLRALLPAKLGGAAGPGAGTRPLRQQGRFAAYLSRQAVLRFDVRLGAIASVDDLRAALAERGLAPRESAWSFYLPSGPKLDAAFPFLAGTYPPGVGLKLLKDLNPPEDAIYASHDFNPVGGGLAGMTPSPQALVRVANVLHAAGLGPRVFDLVHLRAGGTDLTAYVVQHVGGGRADEAAHAAFMKRLQPILSGRMIGTVREGADGAAEFAAPDCHGDLKIDAATGAPLYVDFQAFRIPDEAKLLLAIADAERRHARANGRGRRRKPLYQGIPGLVAGERDVEIRWSGVLELLRAGGIGLGDRVIYDVGCNFGLMLYQALSDGALWGVGWDLPDVARAGDRVLTALGATRFTLVGEAVGAQSTLLDDVPERFRKRRDGLLLYLGADEQIGFPDGIAALPWSHMLYEGSGPQEIGDIYRGLKEVPWLAKAELLAHRAIADSDGSARTVLLLKRPA